MKGIVFLLLASVAILLSAQSPNPSPTPSAETPKPLGIEHIYSHKADKYLEDIRPFMPEFRQKADSCVQLANTALAGKDTAATIHFLKRSLTFLPSDAIYARLTALLVKTGRYLEAGRASNIYLNPHKRPEDGPQDGEAYFYAALSQAFYRDHYPAIGKEWMAHGDYIARLLEQAQDNGYTIRLSDLEHPCLRNGREDFHIRSFFIEKVAPRQDSSRLWLQYLDENSPEISLPYTIDPEILTRKFLSFHSPEELWSAWVEKPDIHHIPQLLPLPAAEGRGFSLCGHYKANDQWVALVSVNNHSSYGAPPELRCADLWLVTFSYPDGRRLGACRVAYQTPDSLATCTLYPEKVEQACFRRTWEAPFQPNRLDNRLAAILPCGKRSIPILPDGSLGKPTPIAE